MRHPNFLLPRATQGYFDVRRENDDKKEPLLFMLDALRAILKEVRHVTRRVTGVYVCYEIHLNKNDGLIFSKWMP